MTIGLVDIDGHAGKKKWGATIYPNLALAKIARYHRERGDKVEWAIDLMHRHGFHGKVLLYTMLHGSFQECYERINHWRSRIRNNMGVAVDCHAQPYRDPNTKNHPPQWQLDMAYWCNKKQLYWSIPFEEFQPRKGFKCKQYLQQYNERRKR